MNGEDYDGEITADGYLTINRKWRKGDSVQLHFLMNPQLIKANKMVEDDRNMVCIERGPLVYCAEGIDNDFPINKIILNQNPKFNVQEGTDFNFTAADGPHTYKLTTIETYAQTLDFDQQGQVITNLVSLKLIPYFAWCHRGKNDMRVWITNRLF